MAQAMAHSLSALHLLHHESTSSPARSIPSSPTIPVVWDSPNAHADFAHVFSSPTLASSNHKILLPRTPERPSQPQTPLTPPLTPATTNSISASSALSSSIPAATAISISSPILLSTSLPDPTASAHPTTTTTANSASRWMHRDSLGSSPTTPFDQHHSAFTVDLGDDASDHQPWFGLEILDRDPDALPQAPPATPSTTQNQNPPESRFLLVSGVPKDATDDDLRTTFHSCGDIKGISARFHKRHGVLILAFYDSRQVGKAKHRLATQPFFHGCQLRVKELSLSDLHKVLGQSAFVNETSGEVFVIAEGGKTDGVSLQQLFRSFGELRSFSQTGLSHKQTYLVEYYDVRHAQKATEQLNGRKIFGTHLRLYPKHAVPAEVLSSSTHSPSASSPIPFPGSGAASTRSDTSDSLLHGGSGRLSHPPSPLTPVSRLQSDSHSYSTYTSGTVMQQHQQSLQGTIASSSPSNSTATDTVLDNTNSSPFLGTRALPGSGGISSTAGASVVRRISTGSVSIGALGRLHQSTSEQDLRRRAAVNQSSNNRDVYASESIYGIGIDRSDGGDPHVRRTSDTYALEAVRRRNVNTSNTYSTSNSTQHLSHSTMGIGEGGGGTQQFQQQQHREQQRVRANSESSASARLTSPDGRIDLSSFASVDPSNGFDDVFDSSSGSVDGGGLALDLSLQHRDADGEVDGRDRSGFSPSMDNSPIMPRTPPHPSHAQSDLVCAGGGPDISGLMGGMNLNMNSSPGSGYCTWGSPGVAGDASRIGLVGAAGNPSMGVGVGPPGATGIPMIQVPVTPIHGHGAHAGHAGHAHYLPYIPAAAADHYAQRLSGPYYSPHLHQQYSSSPGSVSLSPASPMSSISASHSHTHSPPQTRLHTRAHTTNSSLTSSRHYNMSFSSSTSALGHSSTISPTSPNHTASLSDKNQIDLERIASGLDTRTTVMIKNIPNKLTDEDLIKYINNVCPRKIDFLYLRMDFQNGCNVGYAFVNFIEVQDLLHFAKTKLGVKWNMFSSEKILQMSYANYQGKEALVEKFKNSCVMDERESWRPKIFYSSGPNQGLPEPFPPPTHLRRKERSSQNRGALFVPGSSSSPSSAGNSGGGRGSSSSPPLSSGLHRGGTGRLSSPTSPNVLGHGGSSSRGNANAGASTVLGPPVSVPFRRPNQHPQNLARHDRF